MFCMLLFEQLALPKALNTDKVNILILRHNIGTFICMEYILEVIPELDISNVTPPDLSHSFASLPEQMKQLCETKTFISTGDLITLLREFGNDHDVACDVLDYMNSKFSSIKVGERFKSRELIKGFLEKNQKTFIMRDLISFFMKLRNSEQDWTSDFTEDCLNDSIKLTDLYKLYDKYGKFFRQNEILQDVSKIFGLLFSSISMTEPLDSSLGIGFTHNFSSKIPTGNTIHMLTLDLIKQSMKKKRQVSVLDLKRRRCKILNKLKPVPQIRTINLMEIDKDTFTDDSIATIDFFKAFCNIYTMSSLSLEIASRECLDISGNFANLILEKI